MANQEKVFATYNKYRAKYKDLLKIQEEKGRENKKNNWVTRSQQGA